MRECVSRDTQQIDHDEDVGRHSLLGRMSVHLSVLEVRAQGRGSMGVVSALVWCCDVKSCECVCRDTVTQVRRIRCSSGYSDLLFSHGQGVSLFFFFFKQKTAYEI